MYYQEELNKKERHKIIAVATVALTLILALIVAIIVVATKKSDRTSVVNEENVAFEMTDENKEETKKNKEEENKNIGLFSTDKKEEKEEEQKEEKKETVSETPAVIASDDMPSTGPEDILPVALLIGMIVAYTSSAVLVKRDA